MYTVYAFCKEVDNAVDEPPPGSHPRRNGALAAETGRNHSGTPAFPKSPSAWRNTSVHSPFPRRTFGAHQRRRDGSHHQALRHLRPAVALLLPRRLRGGIGLHVFGTTSPRAQDYAVNLGMAFQLTNILRDLGNDAECGRVYLPFRRPCAFRLS